MLDECKYSQTLKEELVTLASSFCRKITSFALLEDITELQGMCFSVGELSGTNDIELIKTCRLIFSKSIAYKYDLEDYGIDDDARDLFCNLLNRFKSTLSNKDIETIDEMPDELLKKNVYRE